MLLLCLNRICIRVAFALRNYIVIRLFYEFEETSIFDRYYHKINRLILCYSFIVMFLVFQMPNGKMG